MSLLQTLKFITSHPLNAGHPVKALGRFAKWQIESRLKDEVEFDWIEGSKLIVRNGMTGATGNIYCGLHEFADMAFALHLLRPEDLFVDVGANIGSYTVLASAVCGARTIAIEPDPDTMAILRKNVVANGIEDRVTLVEAAVGAEEGMVSFTMGRDTTNKVVEVGDQNTRNVNVRTLDDILANESPTLIKMDVEGYEAKAIAGARKTLKTDSLHAILIESLEVEIWRTLVYSGFRRFNYEPVKRNICPVSEENPKLQGQNALCSPLLPESTPKYPRMMAMSNYLYLREIAFIDERLKNARRRSIQSIRL